MPLPRKTYDKSGLDAAYLFSYKPRIESVIKIRSHSPFRKAFSSFAVTGRMSAASKIALCHLLGLLRERGFQLFDVQMITPVTRLIGATEIPRDDYLKRLKAAIDLPCHFS